METLPKKRGPGNPQWVKGHPKVPGSGRQKEGITIDKILKTVRKVAGTDFETLLAQHLNETKEAYLAGDDYRSYTTMLMSIMDRVVQSIPKQVSVDVSGTVNHIAQLAAQDESIHERLIQRGYTDVVALVTAETPAPMLDTIVTETDSEVNAPAHRSNTE